MFIQLTQAETDWNIVVNTDNISYILPGQETGGVIFFATGPASVAVKETPWQILSMIAEAEDEDLWDEEDEDEDEDEEDEDFDEAEVAKARAGAARFSPSGGRRR